MIDTTRKRFGQRWPACEAMNPEVRQRLNILAYNNPTLHQLLMLLDRRQMALEEWYPLAIDVLVVENNRLTQRAIDIAMRSPAPVIIIKEKP